ncbi:MAG TPA: hypothetical protein PLJ37_05025 [Chitinophagales bacterium]|nr:hypothetical protein [Chitinophagales bacterium]MCB0512042.1 hypothetical protein [Bacteroidota bacterium]MCB0513062.1 hypothetical protein [Bacteroidota bacterium]MCB9075056.1 hypothetical protein [Chitinophagales bacterium]HMU99026.1 hypothetical protein [Chitinophagales bacterium]
MKNLMILFAVFILFFSCTKEEKSQKTKEPDPKKDQQSVNGKIDFVGSIALSEGPHQLLIDDNNLYAKRDNQIFLFSLNNPQVPQQQNKYTQTYNKNFGKMTFHNDKLYVCNIDEKAVYVFDEDLNFEVKYTFSSSNLKPNILLIDDDNNFWVGGSNGANGIVAKCTLSANILNIDKEWQHTSAQSNFEWLEEEDGYILATNALGEFITFKQSNFPSTATTITYTNESGHEKWGKSFVTVNDYAYWANWGAGIATVDISNPFLISVTKIISNSSFKNQFASAEGTNAYDVAYNEKHDYICVANGWSGVLLVKPNQSDKVDDFLDPQYFQNMSIATKEDYIYTGNISGGMSGDLKGIKIFKLK